jgi:hypothetical protein
MTAFTFEIDDKKGFDSALQKINKKWESKLQIHQIINREITRDDNVVSVSFESVFSVALFKIISTYAAGIPALFGFIFIFLLNNGFGWALLWLACILYFFLNIPVFLLQPKSLFKFVVKGLRKNGYKGKVEFVGGYV